MQNTLKNIPIGTAVFLLFVAMAGYMWFFHPPEWPPQTIYAAIIIAVTLGAWIGNVLPAHIVSLLFFSVVILTKTAPPTVALSGFLSDAFWLIFGGMIMGVALSKSGLSDKLAASAISRFGSSYAQSIAGIVAFGVSLSFIMPSALARIVLIVPLCMNLARIYGFSKTDNGYKGVVLAGILGTHLPSLTILTANIPNMVLAGSASTLFHIHLHYGSYLLLHFPVLGALKAICIAGAIIILFPDEIKRTQVPKAPQKKWSAEETAIALLFFCVVSLWVTDSWHEMSPAWIAMAAAVILIFPRFGPVSPKLFQEEVAHAPLLFIAGVIGFGAVLSSSGVGTWLAHEVLHYFPPRAGHDVYNFFLFSFLSFISTLVCMLGASPAVLAPLTPELAHASGWSMEMVIMSQTMGFSMVFFPYQSPPQIVGMQLSNIAHKDALKASLSIGFITVFILLPLDYVWWYILGIFG